MEVKTWLAIVVGVVVLCYEDISGLIVFWDVFTVTDVALKFAYFIFVSPMILLSIIAHVLFLKYHDLRLIRGQKTSTCAVVFAKILQVLAAIGWVGMSLIVALVWMGCEKADCTCMDGNGDEIPNGCSVDADGRVNNEKNCASYLVFSCPKTVSFLLLLYFTVKAIVRIHNLWKRSGVYPVTFSEEVLFRYFVTEGMGYRIVSAFKKFDKLQEDGEDSENSIPLKNAT